MGGKCWGSQNLMGLRVFMHFAGEAAWGCGNSEGQLVVPLLLQGWVDDLTEPHSPLPSPPFPSSPPLPSPPRSSFLIYLFKLYAQQWGSHP